MAEKQGFMGAESFPQREIMVYWIQSDQMGGTVMKWGILATGTIAKKFEIGRASCRERVFPLV